MGVHYNPAFHSEFQGAPFTATPIYGFWNGKDAFVEAMVTTAYLSTHPAFAEALHQRAAVSTPGAYPTSWRIDYDANAHQFTVAFDGFVTR